MARATIRIQQYYRKFKARQWAKARASRKAEEARPKTPPKLEKSDTAELTSLLARKKSSLQPAQFAARGVFGVERKSTATNQSASTSDLEFAGFKTRFRFPFGYRSGINFSKSKGSTIIMRSTNLAKEEKRRKKVVDFHERTIKRYAFMKQISLVNNILSAAKQNTMSYIQKKEGEKLLGPESVNVQDETGCTPLYYACSFREAEHGPEIRAAQRGDVHGKHRRSVQVGGLHSADS